MTETANYSANLPGLVTLFIDTHDNIKMPLLATVTDLIFRARWYELSSVMNMNEVSMVLPNLERIFSFEISVECMLPFIRNSAKLKEIKMEYFRDELGDIDLVRINMERRKLARARKVITHVVYLNIKCKHNKIDFGLIEIKRKESYGDTWDQGLRHLRYRSIYEEKKKFEKRLPCD